MRTVGICAFLLGSLLMAQTPGKLTPDQIVDEALAHNARILADRRDGGSAHRGEAAGARRWSA